MYDMNKKEDNQYEKSEYIIKRTIAGTIGVMGAILIGYPMDTIRIRMQVNRRLYSSVSKTYKNAIQTQGVKSELCLKMQFKCLFAGISPAMAAAFPSVILGFLGNSLAHYLQRNLHISSQVKQANAGAFAALVSSIFRIPTMLLKNRMQIMTTKYIPSFIQLATHIIKTEGFFMLYKGFWVDILRFAPGQAMYFLSFYTIRKNLENKSDKLGRKLLKLFVSGGIAGLIPWSILYPIDLAKNIIQCDESKVRDNMWQILYKIYKEGGIRHIYAGFWITLMRAFPTSGVHLLIYDRLMSMFKCNFQQYSSQSSH